MSNLSVTLILLCGVYGAFAGRRYIAIPVDGIDVIELSPIAVPRIPRQADGLAPLALPGIRQEDPESRRPERSNPVLDYVDFGGQTGSNGAFSCCARPCPGPTAGSARARSRGRKQGNGPEKKGGEN